MVLTRAQGRLEYSEFALLDALLEACTARAKFLLEQGEAAALVSGPSNFTPLHAAALTDCHRCGLPSLPPPPARATLLRRRSEPSCVLPAPMP